MCFAFLEAAMTEPANFRLPRWGKPAPLGYGEAAAAAHFVAAPLLAAGAITLVGVVAADGDKFLLSGIALMVLSIAAITLIASVQFGFHARELLYSAADLEEWWGSEDLREREETLRDRQRRDFEQWKGKIGRAVTCYNIGVTLLAVGVALCLIPPEIVGGVNAVTRWIACGAVSTAALGELIWTVLSPRWTFAARS
jgi:hypothetical protein